MMKLLSAGATDPGKKRRNNEDAYLVDDALGLYAVADGIGGHEGGEVASRMAVNTLAEVLRSFRGGKDMTPPFGVPRTGEPSVTALLSAVTLANRSILTAATDNPSLANMGTTVTAILFTDGKASIAHVGDSRAYLFREGTLRQLTNDHSLVAEQVRTGMMTPEQARTSSHRHVITRAVGLDRDVTTDQLSLGIQQRDVFLLCTDGLTELVDDGELASVLAAASPPAAVQRLVALANERGGVDNITVVVVAIAEA